MEQNREMESLEINYTKELEENNSNFDRRFMEFEEKIRIQEEQLKEKQQHEMEILYNYLEQKLPKNPKFSREYINLKAQEENLVKQERYITLIT